MGKVTRCSTWSDDGHKPETFTPEQIMEKANNPYVNTDHYATTLKNVKKGDLVRLTIGGRVYIKTGYDRSTKRYELTQWDDASAAFYYRPERKCYIGFTF
jgi:hypothetical protein